MGSTFSFARFDDHFSPKIVGELNRQHVKLVLFEPDGIGHPGKVKAEITLESHDHLID